MGLGLNYKQKINIGEHQIVLPDCPKDRSDILFIDQPNEFAYWNNDAMINGELENTSTNRQDYPDIFKSFCPFKTLVDQSSTKWDDNTGELIKINADDTKIVRTIYNEINNRRKKGVFFRNGQDIEYLTGSHWFTLQHCKMFGNSKNDGYGFFYKFQRDVFYLLNYMWQSWILGVYLSKAKKTGITQIVDGGYCLNRATSEFQWMIGFMSRNVDAAVENNMKLFLYAFDNLMLPLKPKVGFKAPKGGNIEFTEVTRKNSNLSLSHEVLDTKVFCVPTAEHSFDSHFMNIEHFDEFPKLWQDAKIEPKEVWRNNKAGVKDQDVFRGRAILSSYPPEVDDKGTAQAAEIYRQSKLITKKHGRTESELICYHIPAHQSLKKCIDKSGTCNEKRAMEILRQNRERLQGDRKGLLAEVRQNPIDEKEAFGSNTEGSVFDAVRVSELEIDLLQEITAAPFTSYVEGKLEWSNIKWEVGLRNKRPRGQFCEVRFIPLTVQEIERGLKGRLRIYHDLNENQKNSVLRNGKDDFDCLMPNQYYTYIGGVDPTQEAAASEVIAGSKNAFVVMNRHDARIDSMYKKPMTGVITMVYFERPELPNEAYEDFVKLIIYTGMLCGVEGNVPAYATRLIEEGLGRFLIVKDKPGNPVIWSRWMGLANEEDKQYHLIRTTANSEETRTMLEMFVRLIKMFIQRPISGEKDYGATIKDERILEQLKKFDVQETKFYDLIMALGYCFWANDVYTGLLLEGAEDGNYGMTHFNSLMGAFDR